MGFEERQGASLRMRDAFADTEFRFKTPHPHPPQSPISTIKDNHADVNA
jgi:hypothetical protein